MRNGGLQSSDTYSYDAETGLCQIPFQHPHIPSVVNFTGFEKITDRSNKNETAMQAYLVKNAPLSVCVEADTWQNYDYGIITTDAEYPCGDKLDHCVQGM